MQLLQRLVKKYDAATVFVFAATLVVILELSLMRILVPSPASAEELSGDLLMSQVCNSANLIESIQNLEEWNNKTARLSERLSSTPSQWQKNLITLHAFDLTNDNPMKTISRDTQRTQYVEAANYAAENLSLQSVMSGRTMLANINGSIYRVGDTISLRGGEIIMSIIELGSSFAVVKLANHDLDGDTKRTIYISNNIRLADGDRSP